MREKDISPRGATVWLTEGELKLIGSVLQIVIDPQQKQGPDLPPEDVCHMIDDATRITARIEYTRQT